MLSHQELAEEARVKASVAPEMADAPPEDRFDRYTRLAAAAFRVPIALLVLGDRIDVATHRVTDALHGRPDRVIRETGIRAERGKHPIASRLQSSRRDWRHGLLDPLVANWGWLAALGGVVLVVRRLRRR